MEIAACVRDEMNLPSKSAMIQSGVVPYRIRRGRLEVAVVTSSNGMRWTLPKGHIEPDLSPQDSAAKEAYEEAGLKGQVDRRLAGSYLYRKGGKVRQVKLYWMAVTQERAEWPEMHRRDRRWVSAEQALLLLPYAGVHRCIVRLMRMVDGPQIAVAA